MSVTYCTMLSWMFGRLHRLQCSCSGYGRWREGLCRLSHPRGASSAVGSNGDNREERSVHSRSVMDDIYARIKYTGPMTVADYMREVLTHPTKGYYMKGDVFGQKGDFTTAPEINQVFGELIAVWLMSEWIAAERPQPCQLVELGPGRGTLMGDILRVFKQFPGTSDSFSVHLVEVSHAMRLAQQEHLRDSGLPITWHDSVKDIPQGLKTYFVAHEFFDALPIHQFQFTKEGWREIFVDIDPSMSEKALRFVLCPGPTVSATIYMQHFPQDGSVTRAEVSPLLMVTCEEMSQRIKSDGGSGLVVDYGEDGLTDFTLRAFKDHTEHHVLVEPGSADLTADVDFSLLRMIAEREGIVAHGPMTQNAFLHKMGIRQRMDALLQSAAPASAQANELVSAYEMLTSNERMGQRFKMMAFTQIGHTPVPF